MSTEIQTLRLPLKHTACPVWPVRHPHDDVWRCRTRFGYVTRRVIRTKKRKKLPRYACPRRQSRNRARCPQRRRRRG